MPRLKLTLPQLFSFSCVIPVRITDLNYGGHVGNDAVLVLIHEARMQYLQHLGYTELEFAGAGLIMSDAAIEFRNELFYGDAVIISITAAEISRIGFELYYLLEKETEGKRSTVALAKTGMICYDYSAKKIVNLPPAAKQKLLNT